MYGYCRTALCYGIICLAPLKAFALDMPQEKILPPSPFLPLSTITIDSTKRSALFEYDLYKDAPFAAYIGVGNEDNEDTSPDERFWQGHSYQSNTKPYEGQQRWAGLKIHMQNMLRLSIDTTTHKVTSTMSLAPKTDVKIRGNLKEIRAELRYRF